MPTNYQYINITAKPQELHLIEDPNSETNKAIEKEINLVINASEMAQALRDMLDVLEARNEKSNGRQILIYIENRCKSTLKLLDEPTGE